MASLQDGLKFLWYYIAMMMVGTFYLMKEVLSRHRKFQLADVEGKEGKVIVITGGTRGIGLVVIRRLLSSGCHIIIGCRKPEVMESTVQKMRSEGITGGVAECLGLDLTSMESVRKFASAILQKQLPINILINNAGVMFVPDSETVDGFETHFSTNYLGHFLLTHLLLPRLKEAGTESERSRIVSMSSSAHWYGKIDFGDPQMRKWYNVYASYGQSKMAQIMFTKYLDARLQSEEGGVFVQAVSLHPGVVLTDLHSGQLYLSLMPVIAKYMFRTPEEGADTVLHAAMSPEVEGLGGCYFQNSQVSSPHSFSQDLHNQKQLWDYSCGLLDIKDFGVA